MKEKITILIADDNPDFSQTLARYIEKQEDMEVIGMAKDGLEAVDMIANTIPDIALIDYHATFRWYRSVRKIKQIKSNKQTNLYYAISSGTRQNYTKSSVFRCRVLCCKDIWYRNVNR